VASVSDFFSVKPRVQTRTLMLAFTALARAQGAQVVSVQFFGNVEVTAGLRQAGFLERGEEARVFIGHTTSAMAAIAPTTGWYMTAFDNDAD
jgi:hypothetical protein